MLSLFQTKVQIHLVTSSMCIHALIHILLLLFKGYISALMFPQVRCHLLSHVRRLWAD